MIYQCDQILVQFSKYVDLLEWFTEVILLNVYSFSCSISHSNGEMVGFLSHYLTSYRGPQWKEFLFYLVTFSKKVNLTKTISVQIKGSQLCPLALKFWWLRYVQFSRLVVSDSLQPHGLRHTKLPCPSPTPGACSNSIEFLHRVSVAIQPSHPLSSPSPPAFSLSQHQGLFQWVGSSHQVVRVLEFQLQHQSFHWIFRTDFL